MLHNFRLDFIFPFCYFWWPPCIADADIIFCSGGFYLFSSSFFPHLFSSVGDLMSTIVPYFHTSCGLSAHLKCMSEICCTRLTENTGRKNCAKDRHLRTVEPHCRAISSQLRRVLTIGKNLVKHLHMSSQYGELRPTNSWNRFGSLGTPANFNGFRILA